MTFDLGNKRHVDARNKLIKVLDNKSGEGLKRILGHEQSALYLAKLLRESAAVAFAEVGIDPTTKLNRAGLRPTRPTILVPVKTIAPEHLPALLKAATAIPELKDKDDDGSE